MLLSLFFCCCCGRDKEDEPPESPSLLSPTASKCVNSVPCQLRSELPLRYDGAWIAAYWQRRPLRLLQRFVEVSIRAGSFSVAMEIDKLLGREEEMSAQRAREAKELITDLGPAFVMKIVQVFASRPDALPEAYQKEFEGLLERVRPFKKDEDMCTQLKEKLAMREEAAKAEQERLNLQLKKVEQENKQLRAQLEAVSTDGLPTSTDEPVETCKVLEQNESDVDIKAKGILKRMLQEVSTDGLSSTVMAPSETKSEPIQNAEEVEKALGKEETEEAPLSPDMVKQMESPNPENLEASLVKEKYIFLVRHAQSTWNREVDLMKTVRHQKFPEISVKGVLSSAAHIATREVWHRDHPISDEGVLQSQQLREKIRQARCDGPECFHVDDEDMRPSGEEMRICRFYQHFLDATQSIYCSPLLRALQTAHFALSDQDGWGSIKLLKEAREHFNFILQRDCLGTEIGSNLVDRAVTMSKSLLSDEKDQLEGRVDASDCEKKWWSDDPETEADVDRRLQELWRFLLEEDAQDSCILVTHSNLIKALLMRFGCVEDSLLALRAEEVACDVASPSAVALEEEDGYHSGASWQVVDAGSHELQRVKVERLQNCGVLGLRCVLEDPDKAPLEDGLEASAESLEQNSTLTIVKSRFVIDKP